MLIELHRRTLALVPITRYPYSHRNTAVHLEPQWRCNKKSNCAMPRILATECVYAPAIASTLFIEVANAAAFRFYLGALCCFAGTVFFCVVLCEDVFAEDFEALVALFAFAPIPAWTLAPACAFLART
jgi:hypothetical protein